MSTSASTRGRSTGRSETVFSERLYLSWWGWPLPLLGAGLLAAEIHMGYPGVRAWLPYVVLLPLAALLLFGMGRARVRVVDSPVGGADRAVDAESGSTRELWVGDAHLPLRFVGEVEVVEKAGKRKALGPELDPAAFVVHRGWVPNVVRIQLTDPDDPTPYWLVSTRRPERLAELLRG